MAAGGRSTLPVLTGQSPVAWSYSDGTGSTPLLGNCIGEVLDRSARTYPEAPAVVSCHQNRRLTYAQFRDAVEQFARAPSFTLEFKGEIA